MVVTVLLSVVLLLVLGVLALSWAIRARNMQIWLASYLRRRLPEPPANRPVHWPNESLDT